MSGLASVPCCVIPLAKPEACVSPERHTAGKSSSGADTCVSCITYPVSHKPGSSPLPTTSFLYEHPILPRPELTAKAFCPPRISQGCRFLLKQKALRASRWPGRRSFFSKEASAAVPQNSPVRRECHLYVLCLVRAQRARTAAAPPFPLAEKAGIPKNARCHAARTSQSRMKDGTKHGTDMDCIVIGGGPAGLSAALKPAPRQDSAGVELAARRFWKGGACR